jgi:hypothetical protein
LVYCVIPRSPSSASKERSRALRRKTHDVRATLECGPLRLLRDWGWALAVRRPKPLIPLTTAPHRVSANRKRPLPRATVALAPIATASASTGAVTTMTASDTNSLVVNDFMRFLVVPNPTLLSRCCIASRLTIVITRHVPWAHEAVKIRRPCVL